MVTRKLLVSYDEVKPYAGKGDFLAVIFEGGVPCFLGLKSRRLYKQGRMVFIGKEITEHDVFAKLVDTGLKIENVNDTIKTLFIYIQQVDKFKVGNIISIARSETSGFELVKIAEMPKPDRPLSLP